MQDIAANKDVAASPGPLLAAPNERGRLGPAKPMQYARSSDGASIACMTSGTGPPLLACSPLAMTLGYTSPTTASLFDDFTTATLDRRGFGHSSRGHDVTIDILVQDTLRVADRLGFDEFHLIGYSMGALEAVRIALELPSRVRGLVLHAPYPPDWYEQPRTKAWRAALDTDWNWFAEAWIRTWGGPSQQATPELIEHFKSTNDPEGFRAAVQAFISAPLCDISRIEVPAVVIHRTAKWQPMTVAEGYARGIPGAELIVDDSPGVWTVSPTTEACLREFFMRTLPDSEVPRAWRADGDAPRPTAMRDAALATLTSRERELLKLVATGRSNGEIAELLVLSPHTVGRHIANIYAKLGIHNRAQAAAFALGGAREGDVSAPRR